jgi:hypothetical protein
MTRQAFIRVLLSLLLLVSQQMASAHVMSHLASSLDAVAASALQEIDHDGLTKAIAQDQACSQCLALAQLSGPLASTPPAFVVPQQGSLAIDQVVVRAAGARLVLAFQSRAPPVPA